MISSKNSSEQAGASVDEQGSSLEQTAALRVMPGIWLPNELWDMILAEIDYGSTFYLRQTCKYFNRVVDMEYHRQKERRGLGLSVFFLRVEAYPRYLQLSTSYHRDFAEMYPCWIFSKLRPRQQFKMMRASLRW